MDSIEAGEQRLKECQKMTLEKINKMRKCSYLLPAPGGEVVRELLDEIERLQTELEHSDKSQQAIRNTGAYVPNSTPVYELVQKAFLRKIYKLHSNKEN